MTDLTKLLPGDIVFYKPRPGQGWDHFPSLAAFAQSYPWLSERPWHHVAIVIEAGDPPTVIGFNPDEGASDSDYFGATLRTHALVLDNTLDCDVLRAFDPALAQAVAERAALDRPETREQNGAQPIAYSSVGLVAFALATYSRMLPAGATRKAPIYSRALGVDQAARQIDATAETCVTSVTAVLRDALAETYPDKISTCHYHEPPAAPEPTQLTDQEMLGYFETIGRQLERLGNGLDRLGFSDLHAALIVEHTRTLAERRIRSSLAPTVVYPLARREHASLVRDWAHWEMYHELGRRRDRGMAPLEAPGPGGSSGGGSGGSLGAPPDSPRAAITPGPGPSPIDESDEYIGFLEGAINELLSTDMDYDSVGENRQVPPLPSDSMIISPAMLFNTLLYAGFAPVENPGLITSRRP